MWRAPTQTHFLLKKLADVLDAQEAGRHPRQESYFHQMVLEEPPRDWALTMLDNISEVLK